MFHPSSPIGPHDLLPAHQFAVCQKLDEEGDEGSETNNKKVDDFFLEDILDKSGLEIDTESDDKNYDKENKKLSNNMTIG